MATLTERLVEIAYELKDKFTGKVGQITGGIKTIDTAAEKSASSVEKANLKSARSFDSLIAAVGRTKIAILSIVAAAAGAASAISKWTAAAALQERAEIKLETSLRNLSGASDEQIQALKDQASALQDLTGAGDEQILSAEAQLATFKLTAEEIAVLAPRLLDMAESARKAGQENASLEQIALQLGKTFTTGIGSLGEYGVALDDAQKQAFKLATQSEKVQILAAVLDQNFKGLAEAVGASYEGAIRKADAAQGDFLETLGRLFTENKAWIALSTESTKAFQSAGEGIDKSADNIGVIITALAKTTTIASTTIRVAWNVMSAGVRTAAASTIAAIGSLATALSFITFGQASDRFEQFGRDMRGTSREILNGVKTDFEDIQEAINGTVDPLDKVGKGAEKAAGSVEKLGASTKNAASGVKELAGNSDQLSKSLDAASRAAQKEVDELKSVSEQADSTRERFAQLIAELSGTAGQTENFTILQVFDALVDAREKLKEGDLAGALQGAENIGDMLRDVKENGAAADITIKDLAGQLGDIVEAATQGQVAPKLIEADESLAEVKKIKDALKDVVEGPVQVSLDVDTSALDAVRTPEPIIIPVRYEVIGGVPTFGDGASDIQREADKRGFRP